MRSKPRARRLGQSVYYPSLSWWLNDHSATVPSSSYVGNSMVLSTGLWVATKTEMYNCTVQSTVKGNNQLVGVRQNKLAFFEDKSADSNEEYGRDVAQGENKLESGELWFMKLVLYIHVEKKNTMAAN